ncbi:hypothetical protein L198_04747 [Cryptococcus wingfieldii CBS 7118]|uniref:DDE Tnp4 domain-containing protein n=1 Tax=Cryptococcus wingfieldii CBS 7118 TaxID=1295528 RepID=A0A1E3J5Z0_9TREE|nr:hypothetical protein L198_04747 [Cryptococcus wingfieldii CBS 7118]ODN95351.1 hypothetical protein L198_04747 [Cryptococcus wingfieldii CBS 7118]
MQAPPPYQPSPALATSAPLVPGDNDPQAFISNGPGLSARTTLSQSGKVNVWLDVKDSLPQLPVTFAPGVKEYAVEPEWEGDVPGMDVLVFALGSADDVRRLTALAKQLVISHGHRVRIATQDEHEHFVVQAKASFAGQTGKDGERLEDKIEFYAVASSDSNLKTWIQSPSTLEQTLRSLFQSTFSPSSAIARPFAADLIVAQPDVPGAVSIAELLGLPLHLVSAAPYSPTVTLPHPGTQIQRSNTPSSVTNYLSFPLFDAQIWRSLGPTLNTFRISSLGLPAIQRADAPGLLDRLKVPFSYTWSPPLLRKPGDWKEHLDVTGFVLDKAEEGFSPRDELWYFVKGGRAPIYVKLDSIAEDEAGEIAALLISAALKANKRLILDIENYYNKNGENPDIYIVSRNPFEWLLEQGILGAVCHEGGEGVSSRAIVAGLPSIILANDASSRQTNHHSSFYTTQMRQLNISTSPIPLPALSLEGLMDAFTEAEALSAGARQLGYILSREDGLLGAVASLHRHLPLANMRCDIVPARVAVWHHPALDLHLSAVAAGVLVEAGKISFKDLSPNRAKEYPTTQSNPNPLTAGAGSFLSSLTDSVLSVLPFFHPSSSSNPDIDLPSLQPLLISQTQTPAGTWSWEYQQASRTRRPITGWKSGLREARNEAWTGVKDGAKGFVKAPMDGLVNRGPIGGVFGLVAGTVGAVTRPLGGVITSVTYTAQGALREFDSSAKQAKLAASSPAESLRPPRREISKLQAASLSSEDKRRVLEEFKRAKGEEGVRERKGRSEAIAGGLQVERRRGGVVVGPLGLGASMSNLDIGGGGGAGEGKKWWKGKGKGKERVDGLSPQISSGSGIAGWAAQLQFGLRDNSSHPTVHYPSPPPALAQRPTLAPYFHNALGSIDGSHIVVRVPEEVKHKYRSRKSTLTVNLMASASFDIRFQYLLAGYEGSANDAAIFHEARRTTFIVPEGRYYLGDAGYPGESATMVPFRETRYHLETWKGSGNS